MNELPVLILTQDSAMWHRWQALAEYGWKPYLVHHTNELDSWLISENNILILDTSAFSTYASSGKEYIKDFQGFKILVLSPNPSNVEGQNFLAQGAFGYAHTHIAIDTLSKILQVVSDGDIWMGRSLLQKMLQDIDARLPPHKNNEWALLLSQREAEAAQLAALGHSNNEIARRLSISERTVRAHLSVVFEKLKVEDRLQLALKVHGIKY